MVKFKCQNIMIPNNMIPNNKTSKIGLSTNYSKIQIRSLWRWIQIMRKGPFTHNETNETLKKTNQCDILDCVCFIMTFTHNETVSLVSITNRHFRFVFKKSH